MYEASCEARNNTALAISEGSPNLLNGMVRIILLPERMRKVFLLNKKYGLSYREIGEQLDVSLDTAKQQVYKAVKILKPKIDSFLSEFPFL